MSLNSMYFRLFVCLLIGLVFAVIVNEISYSYMQTGSTRPATTIEYTIPNGTSERLALKQGESIIPESLTFVLGDTLTIHNEDVVDHHFGSLFIPSGSFASITFNDANYFSFECSFQPNKQLGFEVKEPLTGSLRAYGIFIAGIPLGVMLFIYSIAAFPFKKQPKNEAEL